MQNKLPMLQLSASFVGLFFIYFTAAANQFGLFKKDVRAQVWKLIEINALVLSFLSFCLASYKLFYVQKKRQELLEECDKQIVKLEENSDDNGVDGKVESEKQDAPQSSGSDLQFLKAAQKSLAPQSNLEKRAEICALSASAIFTVIEIFAVANLFKPFGLGTAHKKLGLPINIQGIVDSFAIVLLLVSALLTLEAKKQAKNKNEEDRKNTTQSNLGITTPAVAVAATAINLFGKIIQGMEAGGSISFLPHNDGAFPLGFSIRALASVISIVLLAHSICNGIFKSPDGKLEEVFCKKETDSSKEKTL